METKTKIFIGLGITALGVTAFLTRKYWLPKKTNEVASTSSGDVSVSTSTDVPERPDSGRPNFKTFEDSFTDLKKNMGANVKSSGNVLSTKFNGGKNTADFYNNGRIVFGTVGKTGYLMKGTFSDGGKSIAIDKADGGYEVNSGSVWGNLLDVLNKKNK